MKNLRSLPTMLMIVFALACFHISVYGQSAEDANKVASMNASGLSVRWNVAAPSADVTMTISAPDGRVFRKEFPAGTSPEFTLMDQGERLPDGQYTYELRVSPALSSLAKKSLEMARGKDDDPESVRSTRKRVEPAPQMVQSGGFSILNGAVILAGAVENAAPQPEFQPGPAKKIMEQSQLPVAAPGATVSKVRQHHRLLGLNPDQVIPDDLIVQGSLCAGLDCVNGEVFNFDTIRLKENNTRIGFMDTSATAGFPTRDWRIRANESASGGRSAFFIDDQGNTSSGADPAVLTPFTIVSPAPTNSIFVDGLGRVGFRTSTPVLDLHVNTSNTPALRLEQNNSGGFTAQTWDVAGNEANFFVRDVTGGSLLPFRIRPGAPTSSLDITSTGNVGVGTTSAGNLIGGLSLTGTILQVRDNSSNAQLLLSAGGGFVPDIKMENTNATATKRIFESVYEGANNLAKWRFANEVTSAITQDNVLVLTNTGNVGIATAAPTDTLSVNGTASKPGGGSWAVFSDERLKNIKGEFNSGLKALMKLQPLRYEYKKNNGLGLVSSGEHIGFGARAVQKVIPEAVTSTSTGYLQVNNDPIIWTMLNAIKEQQKEIEQLKAQVRQLRATSRKRR